jgi:hypothetical protein
MFRVVVVLAVVGVLTGCGVCGDEVLRRWAGPEGEAEVLLVRRNCGATTGYSYLLAVVDSGRNAIGDRHIFYASDAPLRGEGLVEWLGPDRIRVNERSRTRFKRLDSIRGMGITYGDN